MGCSSLLFLYNFVRYCFKNCSSVHRWIPITWIGCNCPLFSWPFGLCFLCPSAPLTIGPNLLSVGGSQPFKKENTDLTPQSLGWPCSRTPVFSANWLPWPSDPPQGNYTVGSPRRSGTSSHCPDTQTGPPHYTRCSWELPARTWPLGTLAEWPEGLRQGQKQDKKHGNVTWMNDEGAVSRFYGKCV